MDINFLVFTSEEKNHKTPWYSSSRHPDALLLPSPQLSPNSLPTYTSLCNSNTNVSGKERSHAKDIDRNKDIRNIIFRVDFEWK